MHTQQSARGLPWSVPAAATAAVAALVFVRISAFGIWDPWELNAADDARNLLTGDAQPAGLSLYAVAAGFSAFGVHEWSGRLLMGLFGVLLLATAYPLVRAFADRTTATVALIVIGTSPLFLFNSRQMIGASPELWAQCAVALGVLTLILHRPSQRLPRWTVWLLTTIAVGVSSLASGVLQGPLPPLLAAAATSVLVFGSPTLFTLTSPKTAVQARTSLGLTIAALLMSTAVGLAVFADQDSFSVWLGGKPIGGDPPTFEIVLEHVFHGFAPWSALLPVAVAALLWRPASTPNSTPVVETVAEARGVAIPFLILWAAFGYVSLSLYSSRYGDSVFVPVVALSALVALFLRDVQTSSRSWWAAAVISSLMVGLVIRDFRLYPASPLNALGVTGVEVPDEFNPMLWWGVTLGLFAVACIACLGPAPGSGAPRLSLAWRFVLDRWRAGWGNRSWIIAMALVCLTFFVFGIVCFVGGTELGLVSVAVKWGKRLMFLPLAVPVLVVLAQLGLWAASRLNGAAQGAYRLVPLLVLGFATGAYASQGYVPSLSSHFSPRGIYDEYNRLAKDSEPLAEFRVGSRAAAYYAKGEVSETETVTELVNFLAQEGRRWAIIPAEELASVNRKFRRRTGRHLFVVESDSATVLLAANEVVNGVANSNYVANSVLDAPPDEIDQRISINFDDKVELVGFDLELPHGDYVGAGETFEVTWYWRAKRSNPGSWKIFVHVDGNGQRLNGDHEPVDGKYPVRYWDQDDVVADTQRLRVPSNYRTGNYTIFTGLYSGSSRLSVTEGPSDGDNRARVGTIPIR